MTYDYSYYYCSFSSFPFYFYSYSYSQYYSYSYNFPSFLITFLIKFCNKCHFYFRVYSTFFVIVLSAYF